MADVQDQDSSQHTCWTNYFSSHVVFYQRPVYYPLFFLFFFFFFFLTHRQFHKKWASGKPFSQTSGSGRNTVNFLFGSYASCINVIYLFIITWFRFSNFFQTHYMLKQTETVQNC